MNGAGLAIVIGASTAYRATVGRAGGNANGIALCLELRYQIAVAVYGESVARLG